MNKYQSDVLKFHKAMDLHVGSFIAPGFKDAKEAVLRAKLINEETGETVNKGIRARDPIEVVDGLCDMLYVTLGTTISIGVDAAAVLGDLPERKTAAPLMFWRAEDFAQLLLSASRITCEELGDFDPIGTAAASFGLIAAIMATANAWGIPLRPFWDEVQRANMDKVGGPIRADGKRLKPPGWRGPDHIAVFNSVYGLTQGV